MTDRPEPSATSSGSAPFSRNLTIDWAETDDVECSDTRGSPDCGAVTFACARKALNPATCNAAQRRAVCPGLIHIYADRISNPQAWPRPQMPHRAQGRRSARQEDHAHSPGPRISRPLTKGRNLNGQITPVLALHAFHPNPFPLGRPQPVAETPENSAHFPGNSTHPDTGPESGTNRNRPRAIP